MKLAILSDLSIWCGEGGAVAAPPGDVAEINVLCELAGGLELVGLRASGPPPVHAEPLAPGVGVHTVAARGGRGFVGKLRALAGCLRSIGCLRESLADVDMVQLRCPSKLAFLGLALLLPRIRQPKVWARWGGEWRRRTAEPLSYRLQRAALRWGTAGAVVTPVGLSGLPNPTRSQAQIAEAEEATRPKRLTRPLRLLFPARLVADKGGAHVLTIGALLARRGWSIQIDIAGDGEQRGRLEERSRFLGLSESVVFHGWLGREQLDRLAEQAHFVLLPSATEGFPRALTEAAAFRCVPLASPVGAIPDVLGTIDDRLLLPADRPELWANQIERFAFNPDEWRRLADDAQRLAAGYSTEAYRAAVLDFWQRTRGAAIDLDPSAMDPMGVRQ